MSKEQKATWSGVAALVLIGLILNIYFKIPWFLTLVVASIAGIIVGLLVKKLLGEK
jgi:H+/gluconate symporter-like permease